MLSYEWLFHENRRLGICCSRHVCNFLGARIVMYDPVSTFEAVLRLSVEVQAARNNWCTHENILGWIQPHLAND